MGNWISRSSQFTSDDLPHDEDVSNHPKKQSSVEISRSSIHCDWTMIIDNTALDEAEIYFDKLRKDDIMICQKSRNDLTTRYTFRAAPIVLEDLAKKHYVRELYPRVKVSN